jgi:hypothetical protein
MVRDEIRSGHSHTSTERAPNRIGGITACTVAAVALVTTGLVWFQSSGADDSYITYGAASSLLEKGHIANYSGDAVEQSSSLFQVLLVASVAWLTWLDVPTVGWFTSIGGALCSLVLLYRLEIRIGRPQPGVAMLWTSVSGYFAYWAFSGMETAWAAALALLWLAAHADQLTHPPRAGHFKCFLAAFALGTVRPEAPLLAFATLLGIAAIDAFTEDRSRFRTALGLVCENLVAFAVLALWRLARFHAVLPQPVYAKGGALSWERVWDGLQYIARPGSLVVLAGVLLVSVVHMLAFARRVKRPLAAEALATCYCGAVIGFCVVVGGDWMGGARFLCPAIPLACFVAARLVQFVPSRWVRSSLVVSVALSLAWGGPELARTESTGVVAWASIEGADRPSVSELPFHERRNRAHVRDVPPSLALDQIVERVVAAKGDRVWLLTAQGGFVMYRVVEKYRDRVGVVDRRGLLDRTLTQSPTVLRLGSDSGGLARSYDYLFNNLAAVANETALPAIDIIYDLWFNRRELNALRRHGYVAVFEQTGDMRSSEQRFPGRGISAQQGIFVKQRYVTVLEPALLRNQF